MAIALLVLLAGLLSPLRSSPFFPRGCRGDGWGEVKLLCRLCRLCFLGDYEFDEATRIVLVLVLLARQGFSLHYAENGCFYPTFKVLLLLA